VAARHCAALAFGRLEKRRTPPSGIQDRALHLQDQGNSDIKSYGGTHCWLAGMMHRE
jgi:hypothetical protein